MAFVGAEKVSEIYITLGIPILSKVLAIAGVDQPRHQQKNPTHREGPNASSLYHITTRRDGDEQPCPAVLADRLTGVRAVMQSRCREDRWPVK